MPPRPSLWLATSEGLSHLPTSDANQKVGRGEANVRLLAAGVRITALVRSDSGSYLAGTFARRETHMTSLRFDIGMTATGPVHGFHNAAAIRSGLAS